MGQLAKWGPYWLISRKGRLGMRTWGSVRMLLVLGEGVNLERGNVKGDNAVAVWRFEANILKWAKTYTVCLSESGLLSQNDPFWLNQFSCELNNFVFLNIQITLLYVRVAHLSRSCIAGSWARCVLFWGTSTMTSLWLYRFSLPPTVSQCFLAPNPHQPLLGCV